MKVYLITFNEEEQKFESKLQDVTSADLDDIIKAKNPFVSYQLVHKKYFMEDCQGECEDVVADLNNRLCQRGPTIDHGQIRVARCRTCGELFAVAKPTNCDGVWLASTHCPTCRKKRRLAKVK